MFSNAFPVIYVKHMLVPPVTKPWGERVAYFENPEGNVIHIRGKLAAGD